MSNLRRFARVPLNSFCLVESDSKIIKALFVDFSQMGALLHIEKNVGIKKHLSLIYPSENSDFVKMAGYSVHMREKNGLLYLGIQFIAQLSK